MKNLLLSTLIITLGISSCISIRFPGYHRFDKLSKTDQSKVRFGEANICALKHDSIIFAIQASQLKECLKKYPKSIVYTWAPHCKSEHCVPLSFFVTHCIEKGYYPIILADYIEFPEVEMMNNTEKPVFVVDHLYYKEEKYKAANRAFMLDLTGEKPKNNKDTLNWFRYYLFEGDQFKKVVRDIQTL
jgi:hypothetical protein